MRTARKIATGVAVLTAVVAAGYCGGWLFHLMAQESSLVASAIGVAVLVGVAAGLAVWSSVADAKARMEWLQRGEDR